MKNKIIRNILLVILAIAIIYLGFGIYFGSHFFFNSTVNGIPAGGKSAKAVYAAIEDRAKAYSISFVHDNGSVDATVSSSDIGFLVDYDEDDIKEILSQQKSFDWVRGMLSLNEYETEKGNYYDKNKLSSVVNSLNLKSNGSKQECKDAYIEYSPKAKEFVIVDEVYGNEISASETKKALIDAVETFEYEINVDEGSCFAKPEICADDKKLNKTLKKVNGYMHTITTYDLGETTDTVDMDTKATWFDITDGKVSFNEEAMGEFVNAMGKKYNTFGKAKPFVTTSGEEITVPCGDLGWKIAYQGEIDAIKADLEGGKDVTRDFTYLYTAASHGENDYGDSYVEVNLTEQHVYIYDKGEMVFDTDCVTGNVLANRDTHTGAYAIAYKAKDATLRGADYTSHVNYWMPFHNGEGLHDATWRRTFGGTIYQGGGSHGCVNLPLSSAKQIYEIVDKGWPVLVFYTGNTEAEINEVRYPYTHVMTLISSIETVTLESADAIAQARAAYNELADELKPNVTNYDTLVQAEQTLWNIQMGLQ